MLKKLRFSWICEIWDNFVKILLITAKLKFKSKNPFAHVWHISLCLPARHHIFFLFNWFSVNYGFSFPILPFFFYCKNHLPLLKDWFLKKMFVKRARNHQLIFVKKLLAQIILSNWKQFQVFKIVKFEFKVTVHYGLWAKYTLL